MIKIPKVVNVVHDLANFGYTSKYGSPEENVLFKDLQAYAQDIDDMVSYARHLHKAGDIIGKHMDTCATCGHDIRHRIHLRSEENE